MIHQLVGIISGNASLPVRSFFCCDGPAQATFIPALLSHVANLSANSSSPFHNRLDLR